MIHSPIKYIPIESIAFIEEMKAMYYPPTVYPYPEYITVRVTGLQECKAGAPFRVIEIPFKYYVKVVLANEWGYTWHKESIRAGAVAVKMYAWNAVLTGGKWGSYERGVVYDCDWDMVYNPNIIKNSTNKAVNDTWDYYLLDKHGELFKPHFLAWWGACIGWLGDIGTCIGQWNSKADAENGKTWEEILDKYFYEVQIVEVK